MLLQLPFYVNPEFEEKAAADPESPEARYKELTDFIQEHPVSDGEFTVMPDDALDGDLLRPREGVRRNLYRASRILPRNGDRVTITAEEMEGDSFKLALEQHRYPRDTYSGFSVEVSYDGQMAEIGGLPRRRRIDRSEFGAVAATQLLAQVVQDPTARYYD